MNGFVGWFLRRVALSQLSEADRLERNAQMFVERAKRIRRDAELMLLTVGQTFKVRE